MAVPTQITPKPKGKFLGKGTVKFFRRLFIFIFIIIPLLYAIVISFQGGFDISKGIEYFVPRLVEPLNEINSQSLQLIEYQDSFTLWKGFLFVYNILSSIYIMYLWLWVFAGLWANSPWSDKSQGFRNWTMAILIFLTLQIIYLLVFIPDGMTAKEVVNLPFNAIGNFFKSIPFLIKYLHSLTQPIRANNQTIIVENISNMSNLTVF